MHHCGGRASLPDGKVTAFGVGPVADDLQALTLSRLAEQQLIDVLLDCGEG